MKNRQLIYLVLLVFFANCQFSAAQIHDFDSLYKNDKDYKNNFNASSDSLLILILSITFAIQRVIYFRLKTLMVAEASIMIDLKMDLDLFDTKEGLLIQSKIRDYVLYICEKIKR